MATINLNTDELLMNLQDLKARQLIRLGKYPSADVRGNTTKKSSDNDIIRALNVFNCARQRLLCKYVLDCTELSKQEKMKFEGELKKDHLLQNRLPMNPIMQSWCSEMQKLSSTGVGCIQEYNPLSDNKLVYDINYKPICCECNKVVCSTELRRTSMLSKQLKNVAVLSFTTRFKGYCCRVSIESSCPLCSHRRSKTNATENLEDLKITVDPCIGSWSNLALDCQGMQPDQTFRFILDNVRMAIDEIVPN